MVELAGDAEADPALQLKTALADFHPAVNRLPAEATGAARIDLEAVAHDRVESGASSRAGG